MGDKGSKGCGGSIGGAFWIAGFLFTIGYAKLGFWKGVLALLLWPHILGEALNGAG